MSNVRKHFTIEEVNRLLEAAKDTRNPERNRCILIMVFRHGLRVSEACKLELSQVDVASRTIFVSRLKKGMSTNQPLRQDEINSHYYGCNKQVFKQYAKRPLAITDTVPHGTIQLIGWIT